MNRNGEGATNVVLTWATGAAVVRKTARIPDETGRRNEWRPEGASDSKMLKVKRRTKNRQTKIGWWHSTRNTTPVSLMRLMDCWRSTLGVRLNCSGVLSRSTTRIHYCSDWMRCPQLPQPMPPPLTRWVVLLHLDLLLGSLRSLPPLVHQRLSRDLVQ